MKKLMTFIFSVSLVLYLSGSTLYAQGKGRGSAGGVGQNRVPPTDRGEHHKEMKPDRDGSNKQTTNATKEAKRDEKIVEHIDRNPELKTRVEGLLPKGTNLQAAAKGFKNQGEFIAALHVSKNLDIPFDQLKAKTTGPNAVSLGKAIQELRPSVTDKQAKLEVDKAEKQSKETEKPKAAK